MSYRIALGNFKGGTGKSTNSCVLAYTLAKRGYKTLLLDLDPQADSTKLMMMTAKNTTGKELDFETTFMKAISEGDISSVLTEITDNLYILPSSPDFRHFNRYLESCFPGDFFSRGLVINTLLNELEKKHSFDFVLIDTPPTISEYTNNAILSADGVIVVLQTQEWSLSGAVSFVEYLQELKGEYQKDLDLIGILPVLNKKGASTDILIIEKAINTFGKENLFSTVIPHLERLKNWDVTGIIDKEQKQEEYKYDMHDKNVFNVYEHLADELIERIKKGMK